MDGIEIIHRCQLLAEHSEEPQFTTRTFLSPPMREVHRLVRQWMEETGMETRVDAAGNLRGVYGAGPRLMIGSHLDTVPRAGAFDGTLGVMMAIALVERRPDCAIEVAGFSEQEGARFGIPFIGSRAVVGDPVMDQRVLAAIQEFGLDPAALPDAVMAADVRGFLEFHVEQGQALECLDLPVGVVQALAGVSRWDLYFEGQANHAGATPMHLRSDALACAAEWIGLVEHLANATAGLVATVGKVGVRPGAANVIPGSVCATLDVRHMMDEVRQRGVEVLLNGADRIAQQRGITASSELCLDQATTALHFVEMEAAVESAGYRVHCMPSWAAHDAVILARKVPATMLLVRSPNGPEASDIDAALAVGEEFVRAWSPE